MPLPIPGPSRSRVQIHPLPDGDLVVFNPATGALAIVYAENAPIVEGWIDDPASVFSSDLPLARHWIAEGLVSPDDLADPSAGHPAGAARFPSRDDERSAHLILLPTEDCNLRCVYCYEDHRRGPMTEAIQQRVLRLIERRLSGLQTLHVEWFGGEPVLAWPVLLRMMPAIRDRARKARVGLLVSMTTNATLLDPSRFGFLVEHGCRTFQISLDGPRLFHDRLRRGPGGEGTFDRILGFLRFVHQQEEPVLAIVRLNLDADNRHATLALIDMLGSELSGDPRFRFYGRCLWKGAADSPIRPLTGAEGFEAVAAVTERIIASGLTPHWLTANHRAGGLVCYAGTRRSLVIGSDGRLYKCTVAFDSPGNQIGLVGPDGACLLDEAKASAWLRAGRSDPRCGDCFLRSWCESSACPRMWIEGRGRQCPYEKDHWDRVVALAGRYLQRQAGRIGSGAPLEESVPAAVPSRAAGTLAG